MEFLGGGELAFQDVSEQKIFIHCISNDLCHFSRLEFYEGIMLRSAGLAVTRKSETCDGAKLGEVSLHFMLIESMGYVPGGKGVSQRKLDLEGVKNTQQRLLQALLIHLWQL